jgi:hypothetical protein
MDSRTAMLSDSSQMESVELYTTDRSPLSRRSERSRAFPTSPAVRTPDASTFAEAMADTSSAKPALPAFLIRRFNRS